MGDDPPVVRRSLLETARATAEFRGYTRDSGSGGVGRSVPKPGFSISHHGAGSAAERRKEEEKHRHQELEARIRGAVKKRLRQERMEIVELLFQREESLAHEFKLVVSYRKSRRLMSRRERRRSNHGPVHIGRMEARGTFPQLCEEVAICDLALGAS